MRRVPSKLVTAVAAAAAVLASSGCEAKVYGTPPPPAEAPVVVIAPQGRMAPLPEAPPSASFDGLQERTRQATADAAAAGADITITVLDRNTGALVSNGNAMAMPIASVVKVFIADDLLLHVAEGTAQLSPDDRRGLDAMLRASDDSAAEVFWNRGGGDAVIARIKDRYGLAATSAPYNGRWFNTLSTTADLVHYYDLLLSGAGGLPPEQTAIILSALAGHTPTAPDGTVPGGVYPQRFGIPDGLYAEPVAVKQGWFCCWNGGNWVHLSTGVIGSDHRYVMAIGSMHPTDDGTARNTITEAVKTMFPGGQI